MNTIQRKVIFLAAALILVAGLAACGQNRPSAGVTFEFTEEKVTGLIENMLIGYNNTDYAAFTKDMTTTMKLVISEKLFQDYVNRNKPTLGEFQSVTSVQERDSDSASAHWEVTAQFENTTQKFNITFDKGSGQIEGMDFGPQG